MIPRAIAPLTQVRQNNRVRTQYLSKSTTEKLARIARYAPVVPYTPPGRVGVVGQSVREAGRTDRPKLAVCEQRGARRRALFARRLTGKGASSPIRRITAKSKLKCG